MRLQTKTNFYKMVIATNKRGHKQPFSDLAWKMLGQNKNGWTEQTEQSIDNKIGDNARAPLPTGESKQQEQSMDNAVIKEKLKNKVSDSEKTDETATTENKISVSDEQRAEFLAAMEGLSIAAVKQFLERPEVNISYNKKAKPEELKILMAENLGYDLTKLQKSFE